MMDSDIDDLGSLAISLSSDGTEGAADHAEEDDDLAAAIAGGARLLAHANRKNEKVKKNNKWVACACKVVGIKHDDMPTNSTYCHPHKQASVLN